jgi:hypothetical protein
LYQYRSRVVLVRVSQAKIVSLECHLRRQEGWMGGGTESFVNVGILHAARNSKRNWRKTI